MWWLMVSRFMVVTVVVGLMEIGFYIQNQTQKIIFWCIFHDIDKQLKIFFFTLKIFYTKNILHKAQHNLSFTSFF